MDKKPKVYLAAPYTHEQPFIMELVRLEVAKDKTFTTNSL